MKEFRFRLKPGLERYRHRLPPWLVPGQWYDGYYLTGYLHTHPWRVHLLEPIPGEGFVDLDDEDLERVPTHPGGVDPESVA